MTWHLKATVVLVPVALALSACTVTTRVTVTNPRRPSAPTVASPTALRATKPFATQAMEDSELVFSLLREGRDDAIETLTKGSLDQTIIADSVRKSFGMPLDLSDVALDCVCTPAVPDDLCEILLVSKPVPTVNSDGKRFFWIVLKRATVPRIEPDHSLRQDEYWFCCMGGSGEPERRSEILQWFLDAHPNAAIMIPSVRRENPTASPSLSFHTPQPSSPWQTP